MDNIHAIHYLQKGGYNIKNSVEYYYQNAYQLSEITLFFDYNDRIFARYNRAKRNFVHKFSFSSSIKELFSAVKLDFPKLENFRIFTLNEEEVVYGKGVYCIGGLNLINKSTIFIKI